MSSPINVNQIVSDVKKCKKLYGPKKKSIMYPFSNKNKPYIGVNE